MKKLIIYLFVGLLAITSCKDSFLDEQVYSDYALTQLTDSVGIESLMVGLYHYFSKWYAYSDNQGWINIWQVGTDVTWPTQPTGIERPYYNYEDLTSTDAAAQFAWTTCYGVINNANNIIYNVENGADDVSDGGKKWFMAEAKFFRAWAYNILATNFGGVPIVTEPVTSAKTDYVRNTLDEVNSLIVEDLQYSESYLPYITDVPDGTDGTALVERANKAQAQQLLAEVYLRIGEPANAQVECEAIINSGKFSLVNARYGVKTDENGDYYSDIFVKGNEQYSEGNTEAIWVLECENPSDISGYSYYPQQRRNWQAAYHNVSGMKICDSLGGRGIARMRLSNYVAYGLYEDGDVRNSQWNIKRRFWYNDPSSANYGQEISLTTSDTVYYLCPYIKKWAHYDAADEFGYGMWKDFIIMRYSETYLLLAEAYYKQNDLANAAIALNVVRNRAGASSISASDVDMDFILDERIRELIGEENRRMTLVRTGTLVERSSLGSYPNDPTTNISEDNLLLPIPQDEIDLNVDAVLEQNPGY